MSNERDLTPLMEKFEEETGKKAKWRGDITKQYKKWRRNRRRKKKQAEEKLDELEARLAEDEISEDEYRDLREEYETQLERLAKTEEEKSKKKICPECGHENSSRANFCAECGTRITASAEEGDTSERPSGKKDADKYGNYSLICGIGGLFLFGIVLGPIAVYFGNKVSKTTKGKVGMALGVLDLISQIILLFTI